MLFYDHGEDDQTTVGIMGEGKFTPVSLGRSSRFGATRSCPAGQEFDPIDNVCRSSGKTEFVSSFVKFSPPSAPAAITPSVVAPSAPPPTPFLVAPIPPAAPAVDPSSFLIPVALPTEEVSFLDKELFGKFKVKHALLGGGGAILGIAGLLLLIRSK